MRVEKPFDDIRCGQDVLGLEEVGVLAAQDIVQPNRSETIEARIMELTDVLRDVRGDLVEIKRPHREGGLGLHASSDGQLANGPVRARHSR